MQPELMLLHKKYYFGIYEKISLKIENSYLKEKGTESTSRLHSFK